MKTLYKFAQEIEVAYATIYKRLKNNKLNALVKKDEKGRILINKELEGIIRDWYNKPEGMKFNEPSTSVNVSTLTENMELRIKNEELEKRVRELTDELVSLNKKTLELVSSSHILLGMEQQNKTKMIEAATRKSFWSFLKKKKD